MWVGCPEVDSFVIGCTRAHPGALSSGVRIGGANRGEIFLLSNSEQMLRNKVMSLSHFCSVCLRLFGACHRGNLVLCCSLLFRDCLSVGVQCDAAGGMAKQRLNGLDVGAAHPQQCCARVSERMPPNLLDDANATRELTDLIALVRLSPVWLSASAERIGKDPVTGGFVLCVVPPCAQNSCENRIEGNCFLRRLRFTGANDLHEDRARYTDSVFVEIHVGPLESEQFAGPLSCNNIELNHGSFAERGRRGAI